MTKPTDDQLRMLLENSQDGLTISTSTASAALTELLELRAEWAKIEAALRWRDMNSAPYDKTMVALLLIDGNYRRYGVGWYMPLEGWQGWRKDGDYRGPTHWSPLPADLPFAQPAEIVDDTALGSTAQ